MNTFTKLHTIDSLKDIDQFLIKKSIRRFFLFEFIKNGFIYTSQTQNLKENILLFINDWLIDNSSSFVNNYSQIYDELNQSREDINGILCYPKYLFKLLDKAFIFNGVIGCSFNSEFNDKDNFINKIKKELNKLYNNPSSYINKYTDEELVTAISLNEFYKKFKERLEALQQPEIDLLTFDEIFLVFNTVTSSDLISHTIDKAAILNNYSKLLNEFNIQIDDTLETTFTNMISKFIYDIETELEETKFVYSSDLNEELINYIRGNMVSIYNENVKNIFKNKEETSNMLNKSTELFLKEYFFNIITPQSVDDNTLYSLFNKNKINEIYRAYLDSTVSFDSEPQHFNIAIENLKNIYMNEFILTRSNFNSNFISFKLNQYFDEYLSYLVYGKWLELLDSTRSTIEEDRNNLIPIEYSNYQSIKEFLSSLLLHFPKDHDKSIYSELEIELAFNPIKETFNNELNRKYRLRTNIMTRIETFKYYRFELNGLTEYDKYKLMFYTFISKYLNNFNQSCVIELINNLNNIYEKI